jgi:hypothetical protein
VAAGCAQTGASLCAQANGRFRSGVPLQVKADLGVFRQVTAEAVWSELRVLVREGSADSIVAESVIEPLTRSLSAGGDEAGKEAVDAKRLLEVVGGVESSERTPDQWPGFDAPVTGQDVCSARREQEDVALPAPATLAVSDRRDHLVPAG